MDTTPEVILDTGDSLFIEKKDVDLIITAQKDMKTFAVLSHSVIKIDSIIAIKNIK